MKTLLKKIQKTALLAGLASLMLTGCSSVNLNPFASSAPTDASVGTSSVQFPEPSKAWLSEGDFVNTENLRKVAPGLSKDELYYLIKRPHFSEGLFGIKVWNYIFNFRTGQNNDYVSCQYQIHFDDKNLVKETFWKDQACAKFLEVTPTVINNTYNTTTPAPEATALPPMQRFNIAGDVLFAFNRSGLADLLPGGRQELDKIANEIKSYKTVELVRVLGHTDPLSSTEYNFGLGYSRARTAADYLMRAGIPRTVMQVKSEGETELLKQIQDCSGSSAASHKKAGKKAAGNHNASLQACLAPNRRVVIEVIGVK